MKSRNGDIIESKFGNVLMTSISTGCKALLLCGLYYDTRAIYLDEVGNDAIKLLPVISRDIDLHIVIHRVLECFSDDFTCYVDGELCTGKDIVLALEEILEEEV